MAYVAVEKNGIEWKTNFKPVKLKNHGVYSFPNGFSYQEMEDNPPKELLKGSIEKLIGRKLTWEDEPVELKEE